MYILTVGLNHKTAPLAIREKAAMTKKKKSALYAAFRRSSLLQSMVILSTCNRTELYAVTTEPEAGAAELRRLFLAQGEDEGYELLPYLYELNCYAAVGHLFRVAAGLDSMVPGETQILGQLKDAYAESVEAEASCRIMHQLMQKAFAAAKKVHTQTSINDHPVSVSYVAVERARRWHTGLKGKQILVVGAGKAGQLTARYLKDEGVEVVFVSNRSAETAECLAKELKGEAVRFEQVPALLEKVDIVISCTGADHLVVHGEEAKKALLSRKGQPICMIDIAVPRDIDPAFAEIAGVDLWDMDDLQQSIADCMEERKNCALAGEQIISVEIEQFRNWSDTLHVTPVIAALKKRGEEVRKRELQRAMNRMAGEGFSAQQERIISEMGQAIVNQMLREPVNNLRDFVARGEGEVYATHIRNIFSLDTLREAQTS